MRLLLDTHVLLWWLTGDPRLSPRAHQLLRDGSNEVHLSAVSVAEMAIKAAKGRLELPIPVDALVADIVEQDGFMPLPITVSHAAALESLPDHHRDPFDRLLVAQARVEDMGLLSADPQLRAYEVDVIW